MNKVIFVDACFKPVGANVEVNVPTGEVKKDLLGRSKPVMKKEKKWQQIAFSNKEVDGPKLAKDMAQAVEKLNQEGYVVRSIAPVVSGEYDYKLLPDAGYGYGYSYTEGMIIVAQRRGNDPV